MLLMLLMSMIIIRHQISFSLLTVHLMDTRRARRDPERTTQSTCVLRRPSGLTSRRNLQSTLCHLIPEGILTYTIEYIYIYMYIYIHLYIYIYIYIILLNILTLCRHLKRGKLLTILKRNRVAGVGTDTVTVFQFEAPTTGTTGAQATASDQSDDDDDDDDDDTDTDTVEAMTQLRNKWKMSLVTSQRCLEHLILLTFFLQIFGHFWFEGL